MVAAEAVMEKPESESRVKAAAWAWYQRSGGSVTPSAGRSEAFAVRCALRRSTSRFQREAASCLRLTLASTMSDSALTSLSSLDNSSSLSQYTASFGDVDASDPDESPSVECISNLDQISSSGDCDADHNSSSLDLVALHPMACWDCGSSLFDTFELVAMSKKLDAELHEPNIDSEAGPQDLHLASSLGLGVENHKGLKHQQVLYLQDKPYNSVSPPSLADDHDAYNTHDTYDKLMSVPDKQSKQAVYDMFCRFGDTSKHVTKPTSKRSPVDIPCGEECRKHKPRHARMSLHGLAKALHHIRHPSSHLSSGGGVSQDHHHHHHHPPHSPHHQQGKAFSNGVHKGVSRVGDRILYDDVIDKGQSKERHIHHHHHHHYHYLFHSDDDFQLQSLDKSLMVAAAGLRSPKVNPALSGYLESPARAELGMDYGRKWADLGSIPPPPAGCNF